ncbi:hypothetical protein [Bowmanella sp. JS7-9]|uniref:Uncharacterized protein n=1 Tax=Pseudobowmanella zhangzhouensis TaxID=1537679 RepID=A0ABW1XI48_9ALTE|nr:hypothetical protein [Bowmanella sp. JS7-9]
MNNDLLFPILPREGRSNPVADEHKVEQVSKEARIREVKDDEKNLTAEQREQREKQQQQKQQTTPKQPETSKEDEIDARPGHLDIYV